MTNIYAPLKRYFFTQFFTIALSLIVYLIKSNTIAVGISAVSIIFTIIQIHAIYCMRNSCERIKKSFNFFILSLIGLIISVVAAVIGLFINNLTLSLAAFFITSIFSLFSIYADFQFIWGLDELVIKNSYNYPQGKIKLMFWVSVLNSFITSSFVTSESIIPPLILNTVLNVYVLWILYEYLQAVHEKESSQT